MESISYLWRDGEMTLSGWEDNTSLQNLLPILNSPTILQCRKVKMNFVQFSFKDYKVLYSVKFIDVWYFFQDFDQNCWPQFLEQPGIKPVVVLHYLERVHIEKMFKLFSKAFSSAVLPNAFKIVFLPFGREENESLTEFRQTNKTSGEKLELSKGISEDVSSICCDEDDLESVYLYTLERSSI
ncbi:hypothetical protein Ddc_16987 [Ditylenchus destructor]|nr:hypothetical protein Ddc_16987 [Ditylenchus destructor]